MITTTTNTTSSSNHTNQHPHHNSASASASTAPIPPAVSLPGPDTAAVINSFTDAAAAADAAAPAPVPPVEESNITELLEEVQQLLDKATKFNIGGMINQSAAKRLRTVNTQLKVELLKERQRQLYDSEKTCQHELEVAQLRLATAKTRIAAFLKSTRECEAELNTLLTDLAERQEVLTFQLLEMVSQAQAAADAEMASSY